LHKQAKWDLIPSRALPSEMGNKLDYQIKRCVRHGWHPEAISRGLLQTIREYQDSKGTVGDGVLINCLPREAANKATKGRAWSLTPGSPSHDSVTFQYFPAGDDKGYQVNPAIVGPNIFVPGGLGQFYDGFGINFLGSDSPTPPEQTSE